MIFDILRLSGKKILQTEYIIFVWLLYYYRLDIWRLKNNLVNVNNLSRNVTNRIKSTKNAIKFTRCKTKKSILPELCTVFTCRTSYGGNSCTSDGLNKHEKEVLIFRNL